jgi:hypothetical protein
MVMRSSDGQVDELDDLVEKFSDISLICTLDFYASVRIEPDLTSRIVSTMAALLEDKTVFADISRFECSIIFVSFIIVADHSRLIRLI